MSLSTQKGHGCFNSFQFPPFQGNKKQEKCMRNAQEDAFTLSIHFLRIQVWILKAFNRIIKNYIIFIHLYIWFWNLTGWLVTQISFEIWWVPNRWVQVCMGLKLERNVNFWNFLFYLLRAHFFLFFFPCCNYVQLH